jgi:hypothetical protein
MSETPRVNSEAMDEILKRVVVVGKTPDLERVIDIWFDEIDRKLNGADAIQTVRPAVAPDGPHL